MSIAENDSLIFSVDAFDPDGNQLEYLWKVDDLVASTDTSFTMLTDYNSAGDYFVTLSMTDNYGMRDEQLHIWYVEVIDVDRPIVLNWTAPALGSVNINEADSINFAVSAFDPDSNSVNYQWQVDSLIVSSDSLFTFYTDFESSGEYSIKCNLSDGFSRNDTTLIWNVTVINIDQPIVVDSLYPIEGSIAASEGDQLHLWFDGYDPDGNELLYDWRIDGETVSVQNEMIYLLGYDTAGDHSISLSVEDGFRDQLSYSWDVSVADVDQAIVVASICKC